MESSAQNSSFTPFEPTLPEGYELHDDYIIEKVLGEGAFGITYLAKEKMTDYTVVLKENHPSDFAYRDPTTGKLRSKRGKDDDYQWALGSFVNEAKILTRLNHPNIVRVLHSFQALDTAYYVMDYIGDRPLYKAAPAPQELTEEWLLGILRPILNALDYIHSQPEVLLHRDIKPNNIMVAPEGTPVLIDFGAARAVSSNKTQTKVGTKGYAPPEQWSSGTKRGPWTDLYALGATCYYLIIGEAPPDYNDRMPDETYIPLAPRPELQGHYTPALLASIDKALAMRTTDRWQSAQEWLDELDAEHRRKQEEEHRQKVEAEQQILRELEDEKLKVAAAQAALSAAEKKLKQAETARRTAEKKAKQAETARYTAEEKAQQAETARSTAEKKARQAETARSTAEEKARQAESARSTAEKKARQAETARSTAEEKARQAESARSTAEEKARLAESARYTAEEKARQAETARSTAEEKARLAESVRYAAEEKSGVFKFAAYVVGILLAVWLLMGYTDGPIFAIKKDYPTLLRSFLYLPGVDLNKADKYGYTPLYRAVYKGHTKCVKQLIAAKADVNKANKDGWTPLIWAAYWGHTKCVEQLLAAGADVNKANNWGDTPLYWAASNDRKECVKLLLAAKADVNKADKDGKTPLYKAARYGRTECVKLLLAAKADVNKADKDGKTPLDVAETEEIKRLLRAAGKMIIPDSKFT